MSDRERDGTIRERNAYNGIKEKKGRNKERRKEERDKNNAVKKEAEK